MPLPLNSILEADVEGCEEANESKDILPAKPTIGTSAKNLTMKDNQKESLSVHSFKEEHEETDDASTATHTTTNSSSGGDGGSSTSSISDKKEIDADSDAESDTESEAEVEKIEPSSSSSTEPSTNPEMVIISNQEASISNTPNGDEDTSKIDALSPRRSSRSSANTISKNENNIPSVVENMQSLRAGLISIHVYKTKDTLWGIQLLEKEKKHEFKGSDGPFYQYSVEIAVLFNDGVLSKTPIDAGDTILSVNGEKCTDVDETTALLQSIEGPVTIVFKAAMGNPNLVQAYIPNLSDFNKYLGITFKNEENKKNSKHQQSLLIDEVTPSGLLANSVLSQDDLVLFVNMIPCSSSPKEYIQDILCLSCCNQDQEINIIALRNYNCNTPSRIQKVFQNTKRAISSSIFKNSKFTNSAKYW